MVNKLNGVVWRIFQILLDNIHLEYVVLGGTKNIWQALYSC